MRRKITAEILAKAQALAEEGFNVRDSAEQLGVGKSQLAVALADPGKALAAAVRVSRPPAPKVRRQSPPRARRASAPAVPVLAPVAPPPPPSDPLADAREILKARHPGALRELEEGLAVLAAGGRAALVPWLARPAEIDEAEMDPLITLGRTEAIMRAQIERMGVGAPKLIGAGNAIATVAKARDAIRRGRPVAESEDQLLVRTRRVRAETLSIVVSTVVEEERLAAERGVCITCERTL